MELLCIVSFPPSTAFPPQPPARIVPRLFRVEVGDRIKQIALQRGSCFTDVGNVSTILLTLTCPPSTAKLLAARLGPTKPLSSHTVLVPTAFLSFDMRGLPYLEPCFTSAIVEGVNDLGWEGLTKEEKEGNEGYRKWVWERCCPGLEFTGELPPRLEVSSRVNDRSARRESLNFRLRDLVHFPTQSLTEHFSFQTGSCLRALRVALARGDERLSLHRRHRRHASALVVDRRAGL